MATPGADCHITLTHASINGGVGVGFVLKADKRAGVLAVERPVYGVPYWMNLGVKPIQVSFTVIAVGAMRGPDGSEYIYTPGQVRVYIESFAALTGTFTLTDALGSLTVAWVRSAERRYMDGREYEIELVGI